MSRVSRWLHQRGSIWIRFLELLVRTLNACLLLLGCLTLAWSIYTGIMLQQQSTGPADPSDTDPVISLHPWSSHTPHSSSVSSSSSNAIKCPWFVPAIGVVGGATALSALLAIIASCMRSIACMAAHIFVMSAVLTVQACVAAGFYVDTSWQDQLPAQEEAIKEWLAQRLEVNGSSSSSSPLSLLLGILLLGANAMHCVVACTVFVLVPAAAFRPCQTAAAGR
jgi:hypothetical protein